MAVVGRAEVVVRALTEQFKNDLRAAFQDAEKESEAAGSRSGERFTNAFTTQFNENLDGIDFKGLGDEAATAGDDAGRRFSNSFNRSSQGGAGGDGRDVFG